MTISNATKWLANFRKVADFMLRNDFKVLKVNGHYYEEKALPSMGVRFVCM